MTCPLSNITRKDLHPKAATDDHFMVICGTCGWERPAISAPIAAAMAERHTKLSQILR